MTTDDTGRDEARAAGPHDALWDVDGETVVPTELCGGPWSPDAQHGSAVAAILAHGVEQVPTPVPMRPARFTVDLLSPVPLTPMRLVARTVKAGKRIAVVDVELHTEHRLAARASTLLIRDGATYELPTGPPAPPEPVAPPRAPTAPDPSDEMPEVDFRDFRLPGFARAMIYERTRGTYHSGVPASAWMGLRCPVVRGVPTTPFQLAAVAADMGSGLGGYLDYAVWRTINADITIHLLRLPVGDRIGLDGEFRADPGGIGMSSTLLFDGDGFFAKMSSSTYVDRWGE